MPKATFFHLTKEKQQRLLDAAKTEFSRTSLKEASIANIVTLAEIPRGSFYQYFENKEDLYFYYFDFLRKDSKTNIEKYVLEANGDLFIGMDSYFTKMIFNVLTGENASFYKQFFMNMDYQSTSRISPQFTLDDIKGAAYQKRRHGYKLYKLIDHSKFKIQNKQEFKMLMEILMNAVYSSITEGYRELEKDPSYDIDQTLQNFKAKLNWLKNGVYK
ncbi:TetR/AcrR family transcriptional regulator [Enterococcus quebecensis]|uniref:TetR family transcriptional regulator n=1 Tax=Enterococcus quebecensis TaxID=903983 RepID=A0A1E5GUP0_9ENTE|nr:TetR/AcrR family transcriptional regulator [Enterococcus quebecensis]OEG16403.1 TetR family transcriptional regulator [Enterococcus quebecensis]